MDRRECHFIGGPRDGHRLMLRTHHEYYEFALFPEMSAQYHPGAPVDVCETVEKFTYKRLRIQRDTWVFVPASWFARFTTDLEGYVMDRLVRGYIGNPTK